MADLIDSATAPASGETVADALADLDAVVAAGDATMGELAAALATPSAASRRPFEAVLGKVWAMLPEALMQYAAHLAKAPLPLEPEAAARRGAVSLSATASGGQVAVIPLRGAITPRASLYSYLFGGGGGLECFAECFREALGDDNVEAIVIDIDSPGGSIDLVPEMAAEILAARGSKPIVAVANTMAASAAYWIASAADELVVTPSGQVGSVGVYTIHEDFSKMEQMMGISTTIISAGAYKTDGNPYEPLSRAASAALQAQVDTLYGMFTDAVAAGRGVKPEGVRAGFGEGRLVLAGQALQLKMVDRVETLGQTIARLGGVPDEVDDDASGSGSGASAAAAEAVVVAEESGIASGGMGATAADAATVSQPEETQAPIHSDRSGPSKDYLSPNSLREQGYL